MTTEQPIIRERSVVDALRFLHRELVTLADGDARLIGIALSLSMVSDRAEAELGEARKKVRICEQQTKQIDRENQRLRQENDALTEGLGLADGPRRQLNDVIDVEPGLSAILTRHEEQR